MIPYHIGNNVETVCNTIDEKASGTYPEKFLYHIWDEQHIKYKEYKKKILKTVSGKDLKIHFQGHFNTMSGADFKNALVEIDDTQYTGDIEIHLCTTDWYNHQHDQNPAFNSVMLHIVLRHNHHLDITLNEKNESIEILELRHIISDDIEKLFKKYTAHEYLVKEKYCNLFSNIRPEFFEKYLIRSGLERLEKKIKRFKAELSFVSMDQLFFQSILEAMGYSKNKHQFYMFSKDNSWLGFMQKYANFSPKTLHTNTVSDARSLHFDSFVDELVQKACFDSEKYGWYLFRIRPCNHPKTRLLQIAPFVYESFFTSMTTEIVKLFSFTKTDFSMSNFKKRLYEKFSIENKYTKYKLGKDRINTVVVNIFIPILIIYSKIIDDAQLETHCYQIYNEYEGLEANNITNIMRKYMSEDQFVLSEKKNITQQGVLNIYHKFCINNLCKMCKEYMLNNINQNG